MENMKRTVTCGALRRADSGKTVILNGWVHRRRDHGGISFINLRDRWGITQVVFDQDVLASRADLAGLLSELRNEYCIAVEGVVRPRPDTMVNPEMATGEIEVAAGKLLILNKSAALPFQIDEQSSANEDLRLRYRYLDLRSASMQKNLRLRSEVAFAVRQWMTDNGFLEIETPTFIKSTPEGARDYLVPSRLYPGKFYALPQSPQLYKQLLMAAGFDKYFQIARCYRDEDARGDRQPEFTQIDIEMSFVGREDILNMTEALMGHVFKKTMGIDLPSHFKRLSYDEAQELYGTDKPDLRFDMPLRDFGPFAADCTFQAFKDALAAGEAAKKEAAAKGVAVNGGGVKALVVKGGAGYSRRQIEELEGTAKIYKAKGLAWMKVTDPAARGDGSSEGGTPKGSLVLEGGVSKFFAGMEKRICDSLGAGDGDLILMAADAKRSVANTALGAVRSRIGKENGLCENSGASPFQFVWIVDFPMFVFNDDEDRWETAHHMFTWPQEKYHAAMERDPGSVKGDLYDLVLNGCELASGSIRIHDSELQKRVFAIAGLTETEAEQKFGFLTGAFKYGAPPHGGIAPGLDRLVMLMAGETSIKEVIAFPKNSFAVSPMDDSPGEVDAGQLEELHLIIKKE